MSAAKVLNLDPIVEGYVDAPKSENGLVYGPFANGPMGLNLGLNFLGTQTKACSFDCPYCDLGRTTTRLNRMKAEGIFPSAQEILEAATRAFQKVHAMGPAVDGITISGNGEPALHPEFNEIIRGIIQLRSSWMPGKKIIVYTNGSSLDVRKVADAMNMVDERVVKIDAGNEKLFKAVNAPLSRTNLARVLTGARSLRDLVVQSLFFEGSLTNTTPSDIDDWLEVIAMIKPKAVHLYGLSRAAATEGLVRCDQNTLYAIASRLERKTQIKALVFP